MKQTFNVSSSRQQGGTTSGIIHNEQGTINTYVWKGRKEGFWMGVAIAVVAEIIIRLIF